MDGALAKRLKPCGPVVDVEAADRAMEPLRAAADEGGWAGTLATAEAALAPVFAASPYLANLARRRPTALADMLAREPDAVFADILLGVEQAASNPDPGQRLRQAKADAHLLTALSDLGGVWSLQQVTEAMTQLADAVVAAALRVTVDRERQRNRLLRDPGEIPGFFLLALGKHGAGELNYSSDIDITAFFEPDLLPVCAGHDPQDVANRLIKGSAALLQDRTGDGYVFRVDLRLRPDPGLTPPAVNADAALAYYESVGQNWERAAYIKARPCAGDAAAAVRFLKSLQPYVWRRSLDYAAIEDVKAVKQQIHAVRGGEEMQAAGADLKLGRGGIREIEFFAQTQQLILGGRDPTLRSPRTLEALAALAAAGHVTPAVADELTEAYVRLRSLEHRVQMVRDEHTHRLPIDDADRRRVAALAGEGDLAAFDADVADLLQRVNRRYGELFAEAEPLSVPEGSLVFTGVEDDPETLRTLTRMGFAEPVTVSAAVRAWHHGRIPATSGERGRELFTRLAPQLIRAAARSGAPDVAFRRFAQFFSATRSGVHVQSLLLAQPTLLDLLVRVLAYAPRLATALSRGPQALDSLLDAAFFDPIETATQPIAVNIGDLEGAMNAVRRTHRERSFRIGVHILTGRIDGAQAGQALSSLAQACIQALAPAALADVTRAAGTMPGNAAVIAFGKAGSGEMTFSSDLDLMLVYEAPSAAASAGKGWAAETWYGRAFQRLIAALSVQTAEGGLYEVDLRLRPTGSKGPVAVSLAAFQAYYAQHAETWEMMALTRGRVVWSSNPGFAETVQAAIEQALRQPRDVAHTLAEVREMRALLAREKPDTGFWDLRRSPGGRLDVEFATQALQLRFAATGGPLHQPVDAALNALTDQGLTSPEITEPLRDAWRLQSDLAQVLNVCFESGHDPSQEPEGLLALLAEAAGQADWVSLTATLDRTRRRAHAAWLRASDPASA